MSSTRAKTRDDFGRTSEVSNEELEKNLPTWVVETNRFEKELAMASLRSALQANSASPAHIKKP